MSAMAPTVEALPMLGFPFFVGRGGYLNIYLFLCHQFESIFGGVVPRQPQRAAC